MAGTGNGIFNMVGFFAILEPALRCLMYVSVIYALYKATKAIDKYIEKGRL